MLERSIKLSTRLAARVGKARVAGAEFLIEQQDFRIDCVAMAKPSRTSIPVEYVRAGSAEVIA